MARSSPTSAGSAPQTPSFESPEQAPRHPHVGCTGCREKTRRIHMRIPSILIEAVFLGAGMPPLPPHQEVEQRIGEAPPLHAPIERAVGEVIYEIYSYELRKDTSARLLNPVTIDVLLASASLTPDDSLVATDDKG